MYGQWLQAPRSPAWAMRPGRRTTTRGVVASAAAEQPRRSLVLPTREAQSGIVFVDIRRGRGKAVVVSRVAPHLEEEAGVRVGQQLLEVSDPIRRGERWALNDRVSLRYVRDAVRMQRGATIELVLSADAIPSSEWQQQQPEDGGTAAGAAGDAMGSYDDAAASGASFDEGDMLDRLERLAGGGQEAAAAPGTIAEALEAQYRQRQGEGPALTALERRIKARQEYMAQAEARDDAPFFAALAAAFVLPALAILAGAASSGYLDHLAAGY